MRRFGLVLAVLAIAGGLYSVMLLRNAPPDAADVLDALKAMDPSLATAETALADCHLRLANTADLPQTSTVLHSELVADLRLFDLQTVSVRALPDGTQALVLKRAPTDAASLAQAQLLVDALPSDITEALAPDADIRAVEEALAQPNAQIQFQTVGDVVQDADGTVTGLSRAPQADLFFGYMQTVHELPPPRTYVALLTFTPGPQSAETFLAGSVAFPAELHFRAPDLESARALGEVFFRYTNAICPRTAPEEPES